jgi:hypothetical protein
MTAMINQQNVTALADLLEQAMQAMPCAEEMREWRLSLAYELASRGVLVPSSLNADDEDIIGRAVLFGYERDWYGDRLAPALERIAKGES